MMHRGQAGIAALVAVMVLLLTVAYALPVGAQTAAPVIEQAELRLWPEYDDPGVLVIFSGSFAAKTTFPLLAAFPIPAGARNVQATYQDASGTLINRPFDIQNGKLTYELPSAAFHMEYYVDRSPSGEQRAIVYAFEAPYEIQALRVAVQQPARATGFTLTPAAESSEQGNDGLTYHVLNRQNVPAGEKIALALNYAKPDTGLTAPQLAVTKTEASAQGGQTVQGSSATNASTWSTDWLPWLLIGLGVVLLAGIVTYWLLTQHRKSAPTSTTPARTLVAIRNSPSSNLRPTAPPEAAPDQGSAHCTNCGNALRSHDRFCVQCGTPRRS